MRSHIRLGCILFILGLCGASWAKVIRVKADASGDGDGSSWHDAYTDLQDALAKARPGDEIWVAAGTYRPTSGTERNVSFAMKEGVALYGGFAGNETAREDRNWEHHKAILSGEIGDPASILDNTLHVVVGADGAVLDGFTITGGRGMSGAPDYAHRGGGMLNEAVSPTVANCTFSNNSADDGGGMYNHKCAPVMANCTFSGNSASSEGGGMCDDESSPTLTVCTFFNNSASHGGGMSNNKSFPSLNNCAFGSNLTTAGDGGGVYNFESSPVVINCTFSLNASPFSDGGGMWNYGLCSPVVTDCLFTSNSASMYGGGMGSASWSSPVVTRCIFVGDHSLFASGGGMYSADFGLPAIDSCTFSGNWAKANGGGLSNDYCSATVTNCVFTGNWVSDDQEITYGGGVHNNYCSPTLTNCTFTRNSADVGGGLCSWNSSPTVLNCILWGDRATSGPEVCNGDSSSRFLNCDIEGCGGSGTGWDTALGTDGDGNIDAEPLFVDEASPAGADGLWRTTDDGLRLTWRSPCIDAGLAKGTPAVDILGNTRFGLPDLGAYEHGRRNASGNWVMYR